MHGQRCDKTIKKCWYNLGGKYIGVHNKIISSVLYVWDFSQ